MFYINLLWLLYYYKANILNLNLMFISRGLLKQLNAEMVVLEIMSMLHSQFTCLFSCFI